MTLKASTLMAAGQRCGAALLLCATCLGASMTASAVSEQQAKAAGEAAVQKIIPRKIDYKGLRLKFLPFGASVRDITISESARYQDHPLADWPHFTTARSANLTVDLVPMLLGKIYVNEMNVQDFQVNVLIDKDYKFNVTDMFQQRRTPLMKWLKVKSFRASGGSVRVVDANAARGPADITFTDMEVTASNFAIKEKFNGSIHLRTPGAAARNVSVRGTAGPILSADRIEQVPFNGQLSVDKAPVTPFLAYAPAGMSAYPESGTATLRLQGGGNLWDGATGKGNVLLESVVLASPDGKMRGKPFNLGVDIGEAQLSLKRDAIEIKAVSVALGSTRVDIKGNVKNLMSDAPVLDVDVASAAVDLVPLEEIYPFVRAYLPTGMTYSGKVALDAHANGTLQAVTARGTINASALGAFLDEIFEKKPGTPMSVAFTANIKPLEMKMGAQADITGSELVILNAWMLRDGLRQSMPGAASVQSVDDIIRSQRVLTATSVRGTASYENGFVRFDRFAALGLRDADGVVGDAWATGTFDLNKRVVDVEITTLLSDERSRRLQATRPVAAGAPGRVQFRFHVEGSIDKPTVRTEVQATVVQATTAPAPQMAAR